MEKQKRVIDPKSYMHTFRLNEQQQVQFENLYAQIRAVGVNYNQTVKAIHTNFNDRRAVALLSRLEKHTQELTVLFGQVVRLTEEFNRRWSVE